MCRPRPNGAVILGCVLLAAWVGARAAGTLRFTDITAQSGLHFTHYTGAFGKKYLPETLGSGAAFLDFDGDGWQDILLVNGTDWPGRNGRSKLTARLFRNNGRGAFADVTSGSGLDAPIYGMGGAAADFDNDGRDDVLVTAVGQSRLFRNMGGGHFVDVTDRAGLGGRIAFSSSAIWLDYDRDGWLDLLICNYVRWSPETDISCSVDGKTRSYCTPEAYPGSTLWMFRNKGDGTFQDATASAGLLDPTSKALGVAMLDYDADGWPDLFIANDTQPNKLYRNKGNGSFVETAVETGLAFSEDGRARAGMGADAADYDNSGAPSIVVSNFSGEMLGFYRQTGRAQYADRAPGTEVGRASRQTLGFGCFFFDADLDGLLDLLVVNGHIDDTWAKTQGRAQYAEPPHLFHNLGGGRLADVAREAGAQFSAPKVGRGAAFADVDLDGDPDVLLTTNGGAAFLYRNDAQAGRSVRLLLRGTRSNRNGIGARVSARTAAGAIQRVVRTGSSYLSQSELPVTVGLANQSSLERVVIDWPSGTRDTVGPLAAGRFYTVTEGRGVTDQRPYSR